MAFGFFSLELVLLIFTTLFGLDGSAFLHGDLELLLFFDLTPSRFKERLLLQVLLMPLCLKPSLTLCFKCLLPPRCVRNHPHPRLLFETFQPHLLFFLNLHTMRMIHLMTMLMHVPMLHRSQSLDGEHFWQVELEEVIVGAGTEQRDEKDKD